MAATADLTLAEVAAKMTDSTLATYVGAMDALPSGVGVSEFLAKFLQAAYVAQEAKNAANTGAVAGELLSSYAPPNTSTVRTDLTNNVQLFDAAYTVNVVSAAGLDTSVPAYS
jgi:hypothetical protein